MNQQDLIAIFDAKYDKSLECTRRETAGRISTALFVLAVAILEGANEIASAIKENNKSKANIKTFGL